MSQLKVMEITQQESNTFRINNKNGQTIFKIDNEGIIYYLKDGVLKVFEEEKELAMIFVQAISGMIGYSFENKEEILQRIIKNYRDGKLNNLLGE